MIKISFMLAVVLLSSVGHAECWTNLVAEISSSLDVYRDSGGHYFSPSKERDLVIGLDRKVTEAVSEFIRENGKTELSKIQTDPPVEFQVFPENMTSELRETFQSRKNRTILINYRRYAVGDGLDLYICENSFWNERKNEGRINICIYAFFVGGDDREISYLLDLSKSPVDSLIGSPSRPDIFLGFVPNSKSKIPHVAFLSGPSGSGSFWGVQIYSYDPESKLWFPAKVYENGGFRSFSYDEQTTILSYRDRYEARETEKTINVGELANEYGYFSDLSIQQRESFNQAQEQPASDGGE